MSITKEHAITSNEDLANGATLKKGALGPAAIVFFVVSAAGPLVAMAGGIPIAMLYGNGPGIPATFLIVVAILLMFSAGFTAMARDVQNAGAFYAYVASGLGRLAGAAAGMIALLGYSAMQIGLYGLFGAVMAGSLQSFAGISIPWWTCSFAALAMIAFFGYRQVDLSAKLLAMLVAGEYLVVMALDAKIMLSGGAAGLSLSPFGTDAILSNSPAVGLLLCFAAFIGFEASAIYGEEARDPARTIPLATYTSVLLIGAFYALSSWCAIMGVGQSNLMPHLRSLQDPSAFLYGLADIYGGAALRTIMMLLFTTSVFASLLAFHNAIARYLFAFGRDRLLADSLAKVHATFRSPYRASMAQTVSALIAVAGFAVTGADPVLTLFTICTAIGTLSIVVLMAMTSIAIAVYFRRRQAGLLRTQLLPLAAAVLLILIAVLACMHMDVLAAGQPTGLIRSLPATVVLAALLGIVLHKRRNAKEGVVWSTQ